MKKAMTILLTFIMVLQLIPIPAFATEEIATAEDLKAFLENPENVTVAEGSTLTVQISAENKFTKVSVFCDGEVRIKKGCDDSFCCKAANSCCYVILPC